MTTTRKASLLGALVAVLFLAIPVRAEEPAASKPRVVLIGISNYADKQIKARPHAEDDVKALFDVLTDKQYLGVERDNVRLLLGKADDKRKSEPATKENILKAVEWLAEAKRDDLAILVFIGEGGPVGGKSDRRCYFASDSTFKDRVKNGVISSDLSERLQKMKSQRFAAFVDVDFKGYDPAGTSVPDINLGPTPYREFLGDDGTEEHGPMPGRVVFLATNGLSMSLDLKEHGLFTHVLLAGLKGGADKEGYEPDGHITVGELSKYLDEQMPKLAQEHGKTKEEKEQAHFTLGDRHGITAVTFNPAVIAKARERVEKLKKLLADKAISDKLAEEGVRLLDQMPRLKAQQELRKRYQELVDGKLTVAKLEELRNAILESVKIDREAAEKFAERVMRGAKLLGEEYVKKVELSEMVGWAIRGLYRRVNEKLPTGLNEKLANIKKMKDSELKELLTEARLHLGKREDLEKDKDINIALQRMTANLDPYSTFIDKDTLELFRRRTEGKFTGIGVQIRADRAADALLVVTPLMGSPAYKAGVRAGDLITSITVLTDKEGKKLEKPEIISTKGMNVADAVTKIMGKPDTPVKITVKRSGEDKPLEFEVNRNTIEIETVMGYRRAATDGWDWFVDPENKIGYIRLTEFSRNSGRDMTAAMSEMKKAGVQGLVLDLRFNPGGLLHVAREICDLFIDDGLIVSIRPREGKEDKLRGFSEGSHLGFPMVCLVNDTSASGSEIVGACLQDHHRAVIVGERSYGKGSVQNVVPFAGGEMKMTTATFWRPSGKNLNKASTKGRDEDEWGVVPDKGYDLPMNLKEKQDLEDAQHEAEIIYPKGAPRKKANPEFKDKQMDAALKYLRDQIQLAKKAKIKDAG